MAHVRSSRCAPVGRLLIAFGVLAGCAASKDGGSQPPRANGEESASTTPPYAITSRTTAWIHAQPTRPYCFAPPEPCAAPASSLSFSIADDKPDRLIEVTHAQPIVVTNVKLAMGAVWRAASASYTGRLADSTCFPALGYCAPVGADIVLRRENATTLTLMSAQSSASPLGGTVGGVAFDAIHSVVALQTGEITYWVSGHLSQETKIADRAAARGFASVAIRNKTAVAIVAGESASEFAFHGWVLPPGVRFNDEASGSMWSFGPASPDKPTEPAKRSPNNPLMAFGEQVFSLREEAPHFGQECGARTFTGKPTKPQRFGAFELLDLTVTNVDACPSRPSRARSGPTSVVSGTLTTTVHMGEITIPAASHLTLRDKVLVEAFNVTIGGQPFGSMRKGHAEKAPPAGEQGAQRWQWSAAADNVEQYELDIPILSCGPSGVAREQLFESAFVTSNGRPVDSESAKAMQRAGARCPPVNQHEKRP